LRILFVCTGNTCRSPMAQALMQKIAEERGIFAECDSAGIFATPGASLSEGAQKALASLSSAEFSHRAKQVTKALLNEADLVLTMTKDHGILLQQRFGPSEKIRSMPQDIPDPYGQALPAYLSCAEEIRKGLLILIEEGVFDG